MNSAYDRSFFGKADISANLEFGNELFNADNRRFGTTPPIILGFLIQDNGFYILQDNGSLIEYT